VELLLLTSVTNRSLDYYDYIRHCDSLKSVFGDIRLEERLPRLFAWPSVCLYRGGSIEAFTRVQYISTTRYRGSCQRMTSILHPRSGLLARFILNSIL
jgi:hypothetical protein